MAYTRETVAELYGCTDPRWEDVETREDRGLVLTVRLWDGERMVCALKSVVGGEDAQALATARRRIMGALSLDALIKAAAAVRVKVPAPPPGRWERLRRWLGLRPRGSAYRIAPVARDGLA